MSDDEDDLFGGSDSDDTNELIAASNARLKKKTVKSTTTKPQLKKATAASKPSAGSGSDSDGGLFDSDSDDSDDDKKPAAAATKQLSKRERLEALAKNRRKPTANKDASLKKPANKSEGGYDSEDSYDSATYERTKDDDDFLDTTGEDAEAVAELYAAQHFDDERPDREPKKKKRKHAEAQDESRAEPDNPIMAAVHRMKKKKRDKKTFTELEEEAKMFLGRMELAAEQDEAAIAERRAALAKLNMLNDVVDMLTRKDMQRILLDLDLLIVCKRWVQPLNGGTLGNVTVRQRLMDALTAMTGENGISAADLKRSEFGKVVMVLYKHRDETPAMKQKHKKLIEQWSRPIFQKSGNMRDLERVHASRGDKGLAAISRQQMQVTKMSESMARREAAEGQDLSSLMATGKKGTAESGVNRVRVPFSKGFSYSVRPVGKAAEPSPDKRRALPVSDTRGKLSRRMLEKGKTVTKNQRSANISIEGRPSKG